MNKVKLYLYLSLGCLTLFLLSVNLDIPSEAQNKVPPGAIRSGADFGEKEKLPLDQRESEKASPSLNAPLNSPRIKGDWQPGFNIARISRERMVELRRENPKLADVVEALRRTDIEVDQLALRLKRTKIPQKRNDLVFDLKKLLKKQFELDHQRQKMEIEMMQKKIENLNSLLERREQFKDPLIEKRFQEVMDPEYDPREDKMLPSQGSNRPRGAPVRRDGANQPPLPPMERTFQNEN
ncbi:MAG: hypothetical protein C4527_12775 [Candidatus Omnitrophota bacterium]|nr:MAG: hypothetical protein C4527_12775 [Candidatus Omnitrophota bacterium]